MKRSELRPDPEKVRAWLNRSRERAREREQQREDASASETKRRRRKATIPPAVRRAAMQRSRGLCVACLQRAGIDPDAVTTMALSQLVRRGVLSAAVQLHHVLSEQKWPHLAKVVENLVGVCVRCHGDHEYGAGDDHRIRREALPACTIALAEREGLDWYIETYYPSAAGS